MTRQIDPAAASRCFTAEDACRYALAAYYAACADIEPPKGEPWLDEDGEAWASPGDFVEMFLRQVGIKVYREAVAAGVEVITGSMPQCPDALCAVMRETGRLVEEDFSGADNDNLPPPENRADNHAGGGSP